MHIIIALIIGAVSGFIASKIMKDNNTLLTNIILGVIGGFVGDLIFIILGITIGGLLGNIVISVIGACILIALVNKFF